MVSAGILIAGGDGGKTSVEVYVPETRHSCEFPSLPDLRRTHTINDLVLCGGDDLGTHAGTDSRSCLTFSSGTWKKSHTLAHKRFGHSSWKGKQGIILLGSHYSQTTTERLTEGSDHGTPDFALMHSVQ